eukprot:m.358818 g.358818  ORF g.358818 m.358818 type:complete len:174 (+) comp18302_c0_seq1:195-716(+)
MAEPQDETTFGFEEEAHEFGFNSGDEALDSDEEQCAEVEEPQMRDKPSVQQQQLDDHRIFKLGWLQKKGGGKSQAGRHHGSVFARKNWKTRWFVLRDTLLKYYKQQTISGKEKAIGWINITNECTVVSDGTPEFTLTTPNRSYEFIAPSATIASEWVQLITVAVNRADLEGDL